MNGFDAVAAPTMIWLAETSLQVAVLAIVLLAVEAILWRVLTPRSRVWMWSLVLVRLVLPPIPALLPGDLAAGTKLVARIEHAAGRDVAIVLPPPPAIVSSPTNHTKPSPTRAAAAGAARPDAADGEPTPPGATGTTGAPGAIGETSKVATEVREPEPAGFAFPAIETMLFASWAIGATVALGLLAAREMRFRRALRRARRVEDPALLREVETAARGIGLEGTVTVLATDLVAGPAATGIRRRLLLLPDRFAVEYSPEARHCVLLHELAHLRRRDALGNAVLAILRAVFWFHPLVHIALARLHDAREALRDREALSAAGAPPPAIYARTLLEAIERMTRSPETTALSFLRGQEWKRRFAMIQSYRPSVPFSRLTSGALVLLVAGAVFTGAASQEITAVAAPRIGTEERIRVEGYAKRPEWRQEIDRRLAQLVPELKIPRQRMTDALRDFATQAKIDVIIPDDLQPFPDMFGTLEVRSVATGDALAILLEPAIDLGFEPVEGGVRIVTKDVIRPDVETRFYSLAPFLEGLADEEAIENRKCGIIDHLRVFIDNSWRFDTESYSMRTYRDLLVISADPAIHDSAKTFLERLLAPIEQAAEAPHVAKEFEADLRRRLGAKFSLEASEANVESILDAIREKSGVTVVMTPGSGSENASLVVKDVPLADAITALGRSFGLFAVIDRGVVRLQDAPECEVQMYEIGSLIRYGDPDERGSAIESLIDVIRTQVDPQSWDSNPVFQIAFYGDRMIVRQTARNHKDLRAMLEALGRALGNS